MKAKLIKTEVNYLLENEEGVIIASTSLKKEGLALSLKNCQAIERNYDLDELANKEYLDGYDTTNLCKLAFKEGFQKALEILGDKKFNEDDVISMIEKSRETGLTAEYLILTKQQTEFDVEIVMDICGDKVYAVPEPKLYADNNLILKRK